MRIIRLVVIMLMVLAAILPQITLASETANTDINTNIDFSKITNFLFPLTALADETPAVSDETDTMVVPEEAIVKTEEEIKNEAILAKWKQKQVKSWDNLPNESFSINASAYTAAADECGKSNGITSSGIKVQEKRTLACPPNFPFGARVSIEGMGTYTCEDRGGAIKGNHFDIYMETKKEAFAFGRRNLMAQVVIE